MVDNWEYYYSYFEDGLAAHKVSEPGVIKYIREHSEVPIYAFKMKPVELIPVGDDEL